MPDNDPEHASEVGRNLHHPESNELRVPLSRGVALAPFSLPPVTSVPETDLPVLMAYKLILLDPPPEHKPTVRNDPTMDAQLGTFVYL